MWVHSIPGLLSDFLLLVILVITSFWFWHPNEMTYSTIEKIGPSQQNSGRPLLLVQSFKTMGCWFQMILSDAVKKKSPAGVLLMQAAHTLKQEPFMISKMCTWQPPTHYCAERLRIKFHVPDQRSAPLPYDDPWWANRNEKQLSHIAMAVISIM